MVCRQSTFTNCKPTHPSTDDSGRVYTRPWPSLPHITIRAQYRVQHFFQCLGHLASGWIWSYNCTKRDHIIVYI